MKKTLLLAPLAGLVLLSGCSSVNYGDPDKTETLTIDWGSKDLQTFAQYMSDSLIGAPNMAYLDKEGKGADKRIVVAFGDVANETREHINTDQITRLMQSDLFETGKFRFVARNEAGGQGEVAREVNFQASGVTDPATAIAFGKQINADVVVYGNLSDIYKERGRSIESLGSKSKDLYYQFYMAAVNVETGELLWVKTEDIRKTQTVSLFGRG